MNNIIYEYSLVRVDLLINLIYALSILILTLCFIDTLFNKTSNIIILFISPLNYLICMAITYYFYFNTDLNIISHTFQNPIKYFFIFNGIQFIFVYVLLQNVLKIDIIKKWLKRGKNGKNNR